MVSKSAASKKACVKYACSDKVRVALATALLLLSFMSSPARSFKYMYPTTSGRKHSSRTFIPYVGRPGLHPSMKEDSCTEGCNVYHETCSLDRRELVSRALRSVFTLPWIWGVVSTSSFPALAEEVAQGTPEEANSISYAEFQLFLQKSQIVKCDFYGANFEKAVVQLADGTRAVIKEGYPEDVAFSDNSPLKVVASLRNAGVPFTTQFNVKRYAKPQVYKSKETLEAEARQREEDERMEQLMAQ